MDGYRDRSHAGGVLAETLSGRADASSLIVGLPRGGVPVAAEVARLLEAELGVLVVRKVGVPWQPELAMGAVATDGLYLDSHLIAQLGLSIDVVEGVVATQREQIRRRMARLGITEEVAVRDRDVVLVDDGLATGSSMIAAVRVVKGRGPRSLVVAVPVASESGAAAVSAEGVDLVCPLIPGRFLAVGEWYLDFAEVSDDEVRSLLGRD